MCVYSLVTDHYTDKWRPFVTPVVPYDPGCLPPQSQPDWATIFAPKPLTKEEIEDFRKDVAEFKTLLERAREYDRRTGQPDCELDSKKKLIKAIAAALGLDVSFIDG